MSETMILTPSLSPAFSRARTLSRIMAVLFLLAFLLMLTTLIAVPVMAVIPFPRGGIGLVPGITLPMGALSGAPLMGAVVAGILLLLPVVMVLHHLRKLFASFARGEVFAAEPIAHIHGAGLWLTASFFANIAGVTLLQYYEVHYYVAQMPMVFPGFFIHFAVLFAPALFTGISTTVAAMVMDEARRIAADHAEII